eukprot:gene11867-7604_t
MTPCLLFLVVGVAWTCAASQSEEELKILVDFTVQKVGYAARIGAVASTWLNGDDMIKKPSAGQICKMFRPIYSARAYMPHVTHLGIQACIQALELQYRRKSSAAGVRLLEMLSEAPSHLEEYFLYDDEAAELHATWSRMYATLDDFEKAATKAEDAAKKFFRVHDWLRGAMLVGDVITLQQEAGRQEDALATFTKYTDHKWVHWRLFLQ